MHLAYMYIILQGLEEERRREARYLPDPDPTVAAHPQSIASRPARRSPAALIGGLAASVRGRATRVGRRLAPEG